MALDTARRERANDSHMLHLGTQVLLILSLLYQPDFNSVSISHVLNDSHMLHLGTQVLLILPLLQPDFTWSLLVVHFTLKPRGRVYASDVSGESRT